MQPGNKIPDTVVDKNRFKGLKSTSNGGNSGAVAAASVGTTSSAVPVNAVNAAEVENHNNKTKRNQSHSVREMFGTHGRNAQHKQTQKQQQLQTEHYKKNNQKKKHYNNNRSPKTMQQPSHLQQQHHQQFVYSTDSLPHLTSGTNSNYHLPQVNEIDMDELNAKMQQVDFNHSAQNYPLTAPNAAQYLFHPGSHLYFGGWAYPTVDGITNNNSSAATPPNIMEHSIHHQQQYQNGYYAQYSPSASVTEHVTGQIRHKKTSMQISRIHKTLREVMFRIINPSFEWKSDRDLGFAQTSSSGGCGYDDFVGILGNVALENDCGQWRTAACMVLTDMLQVHGEKVVLREGLHTDMDAQVLFSYGWSAVDFRYVFHDTIMNRTMYYVPDNRPEVIEYILKANWSLYSISYICIICPSITTMVEESDNSMQYASTIIDYMIEKEVCIASHLRSSSLNPSFSERSNNFLFDSFVGLSVHTFPMAFVHQLDSSVWNMK